MLRSLRAGAIMAAATVLLALPSAAEYSVKISLSREDPDVHTLESSDAEMLEFHLFIDGEDTRGGEFGVLIDGGELIEYVIDQEKGWVALPIPNPYPGTVAQAGIRCYDAPAYIGSMRVKPNEPGAHVSLDVMPSERSQHAVILRCDNSPEYGLRGFPAAVNGEATAPHEVRGEVGEPPTYEKRPYEGHDHSGHDHSGHDHVEDEKGDAIEAEPDESEETSDTSSG